MAQIYLSFYAKLVLLKLMPAWYQKDFLDERKATKHAHYRRFSRKYRARRKLVRTLWTGTGCLMLLFPTPPIVVGAVIFSTCLSFAILDESE